MYTNADPTAKPQSCRKRKQRIKRTQLKPLMQQRDPSNPHADNENTKAAGKENKE
jgi:hypothetical protein